MDFNFQYLLIYWTMLSFSIMVVLRIDIETLKEAPIASISTLLFIGPLGWLLITVRTCQHFINKHNS